MRTDPSAPGPDVVARAGQVLAGGGLVVLPTETVYGLGANALDPVAVRAVFSAKGRPATDPLIVHLADPAGVRAVVASWPDAAARLAERFWPGPLTIVVPRAAVVPDEVTAGGATVAVRVPAHPVTRAVITAAGVPVAAPSANRFGRVSPTEAEHVIDELDGGFDLLVDAGACMVGIESTVVDLSGSTPVLLRPGGVDLESLCEVLGEVHHVERRVVGPEVSATSPGQSLAHYAPRTSLVLVDGPDELVDELVDALAQRGRRPQRLWSETDPGRAATGLYAALRHGDAGRSDVLVVGTFAPTGVGRAINDRLFRAAHGRVVHDAAPATVDRLIAQLVR